MKNKSILVLATLMAILFSQAALAADNETALISTPLPAQVSVAAAPAENMPASINQVNKLSLLVDKGAGLITARLSSLVALRKKISGSKLTEQQKTELLTMIDEQATSLTNLLGQIKAGTDIKAVREQIKGIFTNYRIYAVFIPKINTLVGLDGLQNHLDNFNNNIFVKVEERLAAAQAKGKNVVARQTALNNAKAMAGDIQTNITYTVKEVTSLKPADYPKVSSVVLKGGRSAFKDTRRAFLKFKSFLRGTGVVR